MERSLFSALLPAVVAHGVHVAPLCIGLTLVGASPAHPQQTAEIDTNGVYESKGSVAGPFFAVPQAIPKSLMNLILHPLKKFTIWAEHTKLPTRTLACL